MRQASENEKMWEAGGKPEYWRSKEKMEIWNKNNVQTQRTK